MLAGRRMRMPALAAVAALVTLASRAEAQEERSPLAEKPGYAQVMATAFAGDGLRFNNPYRLSTVLSSDAQSVSRTAAYADVGVAMTIGPPLGLQHGLALRTSFALEGVEQGVLTPAYLLYRRWRAWAAYARAGIPIVLAPDVTWGLEGGAGGAWFVRGGVGVAGELVGDVFYGAGTREVRVPAYPVLSAQLGVLLSWEAMR
jgi:hypothetical protein